MTYESPELEDLGSLRELTLGDRPNGKDDRLVQSGNRIPGLDGHEGGFS